MHITLRPEQPNDYRIVEEITREAFWGVMNLDGICDEHYLVHQLRKSDVFVPELDYVALDGDRIIGHILYTRATVTDENLVEHEVLTFGPLTVLPEYQNRGIGGMLLKHTIEKARELGYRAIILFGHPDYYPHFGFKRAKAFGIATSWGDYIDAHMALPLYEGALDGITGKFVESSLFDMKKEDVLAFDQSFPAREPVPPEPVSILHPLLSKEAIQGLANLKINYLEDLFRFSDRELLTQEGIDSNSLSTIRKIFRQHCYPAYKNK